MSTSNERPVPFLYLDNDHKFVIGEEAAKSIGEIKGKLVIISIAGLYSLVNQIIEFNNNFSTYILLQSLCLIRVPTDGIDLFLMEFCRTGKSYILNHFLGRQRGFEIGGTVNACTKGIYTWGQPMSFTNSEGETFTIIFMDTEGIGSFEQDQTHDAKIFSLAVLLSSFFIYNSMGVIDENALEKLSFIANLTKHIHVHAPTAGSLCLTYSGSQHVSGEDENDKAGKIREMSPFFPQFLWLLRDFGLKLVDSQNNPITPREYLENALTFQSKDESKNEVRQSIMSAFRNRNCFTLVRPVIDEEDMQRLDEIPFTELRDKFREGMEVLKKKVFDQLRPKLVFGAPIHGKAYLTMVQTYVDAINNGTVPTIKTAWANVSELECKNALENALRVYHEKLGQAAETFPVEQDELFEIHLAGKALATEQFTQQALGDSIPAYREKLEVDLLQEYSKYTQKNDSASESTCRLSMEKLYAEIDQQLKDEKYPTCTDLAQEWKRVGVKYLATAKGKFKHVILSEYYKVHMSDTLVLLDQQLLEKMRKAHEEELRQARNDLKDEKEEKRLQREEFNEQKQKLNGQIELSTKHITTLEESNQQLKKEYQNLEETNKQLQAELKSAKDTIASLQKKEVETKPKDDLPQIQMAPKQKKKKGCVIS